MSSLASKLLAEFQEIAGFDLVLPAEYEELYRRLCAHLATETLRNRAERRRWLLAHVNRKFRLNAKALESLYGEAASLGHTFNFHEKADIQLAFDREDWSLLAAVLRDRNLDGATRRRLDALFQPVDEQETLRLFRSEVATPTKLRREKGERPIGREILLAAFAAYLFCSADQEVLHRFFDKAYSPDTYECSFWLQLRRMHPRLYNRDRTLDIVRIDAGAYDCYDDIRSRTLALVAESYRSLNNHGHLAIILEPTTVAGRLASWELASDVALFAEKHIETPLRNSYFQHAKVQSATISHIPLVDPDRARFDLANEGFTYRDTFVIPSQSGAEMGDATVLIVLQKNERDETLIPCPACRSHDVQGNSYPALGVRSWECSNLLCPDRSKYNRGKRYSFRALLMQEAIDDERNEIPAESVKSWIRDVQCGRTVADVVEMLVRHYSLYGDTVHVNGKGWALPREILGRNVKRWTRQAQRSDRAAAEAFFDGSWFHRYIAHRLRAPTATVEVTSVGLMTVVQADSYEYLCTQPSESFDGAVTSPPYYNAREYAQWDNIYAYMHDMFNVGREVFRVLRPGAVFLYNVFDYFDNERSIVLSAMGQKRMILSALTVDAFKRAGFTCAGNIAWDKGDIEGKRGFNAGNYSPYYQAPFNCWEHILVFAKPPFEPAAATLPAILHAKPVTKMVRGENTHGHTAPYPEEVPALLARFVRAGSRVLDPFGGSGTTGRALARHGIETVCVDRERTYCQLAVEMYRADMQSAQSAKMQLGLFAGAAD